MSEITDSQFYMWRTLFAMAHVDNTVSDEEVRFMAEALEDIPFSDEQESILRDDIKHPKDVGEMFGRISDDKDQAKFFEFAQKMVWVDGDYGKEEQEIMLKLQSQHIQTVDVDNLVGNIDLEFEDGSGAQDAFSGASEKADVKEVVHSFRQQFLRKRFND